MSQIYVAGMGAVSPAGWGAPELRAALEKGVPLASRAISRPGWNKPLQIREVPAPAVRPAFLAHPRLRRSSPLTQHSAAAVAEAFEPIKKTNAKPRVGLVMCLCCGCIQYSYRFFDEVAKDPATASPLFFPETVFAAPASHIAALFENMPLVTTVVGDPATYFQGIALATDWLMEGRVDVAIVVGAEEVQWLLSDAYWHFVRRAILSGGAGAICLTLDPAYSMGISLGMITSPHHYSYAQDRGAAARKMRAQLPHAQLLCDGLQNLPKSDAPEARAWRGWTGPRISPKTVLGEGLMAASAWQCVAACDALAQKKFSSALVSLVGCNQQAIGAQFIVA
jgi:3-oxoacyl-(acyl-carrier-protein) synthase